MTDKKICNESSKSIITTDLAGMSDASTIDWNTITCTSLANRSIGNSFSSVLSDSKLDRTCKLLDNIKTMANCMSSISKVYSFIDIRDDDILLTLADTGEIVSVNQLVKDSRELKKIQENVKY